MAVSQLDFEVVPGITGALLNESKSNAANVIALIVEAHSEIPDVRAAALMVEAIDILLLKLTWKLRRSMWRLRKLKAD